MHYDHAYIPENGTPPAVLPQFQHLLDTYVSEINKVAAVWNQFREDQLDFRPHPKSSSVRQIFTHQILSERRFFAEFLGFSEPPVEDLLPTGDKPTVQTYIHHCVELARRRLSPLSAATQDFWLQETPFFDVSRQRIWIFWRRVLHTAHHRTQLTVYLRLLDLRVPATYGPTADVSWEGADPTTTLEAAKRK